MRKKHFKAIGKEEEKILQRKDLTEEKTLQAVEIQTEGKTLKTIGRSVRR